MASLGWISLVILIEYHMKLLLLCKKSHILIQIDCYQGKHLALLSIKSLLIIVILVLIVKTNTDDSNMIYCLGCMYYKLLFLKHTQLYSNINTDCGFVITITLIVDGFNLNVLQYF